MSHQGNLTAKMKLGEKGEREQDWKMEEEGVLTDQEPVVSALFLNSALNCL